MDILFDARICVVVEPVEVEDSKKILLPLLSILIDLHLFIVSTLA